MRIFVFILLLSAGANVWAASSTAVSASANYSLQSETVTASPLSMPQSSADYSMAPALDGDETNCAGAWELYE